MAVSIDRAAKSSASAASSIYRAINRGEIRTVRVEAASSSPSTNSNVSSKPPNEAAPDCSTCSAVPVARRRATSGPGSDVVGVDINPQPHYCGDEFYQADATTVLERMAMGGGEDEGYDAIHASPPCQAYSIATAALRASGTEYPDLVAATRARWSRQGRRGSSRTCRGRRSVPTSNSAGACLSLPPTPRTVVRNKLARLRVASALLPRRPRPFG